MSNRAGYYIIRTDVLKGTNVDAVYVKSFKITEAMTMISGVFEFTLVPVRQSLYEILNGVFERYVQVEVYFTNGTYETLKGKFIIKNKRYAYKRDGIEFTLGMTYPTDNLRIMPAGAYENFNQDGNVKNTIQYLLKTTKTNTLYERIIYPSIKEVSTAFEERVDSEKLAGYHDTVESILYLILNDTSGAYVFTTTLKDRKRNRRLNTLYIYDTGAIIDDELRKQNFTQDLRDDNVLSFEPNIDYDKIHDVVNIDSDEDTTVIKQSSSSTAKLSKQPFQGLQGFISKPLNIPDIIFNKSLDYSATDGTNSARNETEEYAKFLIRQSLNSSISIEVIVNSMFIDTREPSRGIWQLGARIQIQNNNMIRLLSNEFRSYIANTGKYYFIVKAIYSEGDSNVRLVLGLSDLIRTTR